NRRTNGRTVPEFITYDVASRVRKAVDMMRQYNVSQLPVLDTGILVGSLREEILMKALLEHPKMYDDYVAKVMEKPFPLVEPGADLEQVYKQIGEHTSELQSHLNLVCRLLLEKKNLKQKVY